MRIAYFDCFAGASGDMILAALLGVGVDLNQVRRELAKLPVGGYDLRYEPVDCNGFQAGRFTVHLTEEQHHHRHAGDICRMIDQSALSPSVKQTAVAIFGRLAEAEGRVHGTPAETVHFHEVGAVDSIVDVVGAAVALEALAVDRVECSALPPGGGTVTCEHGVLPVPAPATAELLKGVPLAPSPVQSELVTPTGAAILTTIADRFGPVPSMKLVTVGTGAGRKRFEAVPNVLRVLVGEARPEAERDRVWILETTLDDASGEWIGYAVDRLLADGALDAFVVPIQMKKNRPGALVRVLCAAEQIEAMETILFEETGTFGVRRYAVDRTKRHRRRLTVQTSVGPVVGMLGWLDEGEPVFSPEYDDCRRVAERAGLPLRRVYQMAAAAYAHEAASTDASTTQGGSGEPGA